MNILKKLLTVPATNDKKTIDVVQLWEVRWTACTNTHWEDDKYTDPIKEVECFITEGEAKAFAQSLADALKLRKESRKTPITVTKRP